MASGNAVNGNIYQNTDITKTDLSENITMNECQEPISDGFISFFNPFHISALLCN